MANLGSAGVQAVGLIALATVGNAAPYWVCAIYLVLLAAGGVGAAFFMDNVIAHRNGISLANLRSILSVPDTWALSFFYMCASGSFLGFAFAFGQVLQHNFAASGDTPAQASLHAAQIAFIGPLLGSLARIAGGKASDHYGGGRVTLSIFLGAVVAGGVLIAVSTSDGPTHTRGHPLTGLTMAAYVIGFMGLFICCGAGKAPVYKLISSVFQARSAALDLSDAERANWARVRSGALIGLAGAFGALGGVGINLALRQSYSSTGGATAAFWVFLVCYVAAAMLAWVRYVRPQTESVRVAAVVQPSADEAVKT
jgi:NNP family nitrate/nitrite transporter-like MFS transporter